MDAIRNFLGLTSPPKPTPSFRKDAQQAATASKPSTNLDMKPVVPAVTVKSVNTNLANDRDLLDAHYRKAIASLVCENEFHKLPEPGFYGSDECMESFNDKWVLYDMMFLTFYYPMVPADDSQQPQDLMIVELLELC